MNNYPQYTEINGGPNGIKNSSYSYDLNQKQGLYGDRKRSLSLGVEALVLYFVIRPVHIIHKSLQTETISKINIIPTSYELGNLNDAVSTLLDLKRELNRSELRYRKMFDNMVAGCMVLTNINNQFHIEDINESCRLLPALGIGWRQVSNLNDILNEDDAALLYEALRNAVTQQAYCHIEEFSLPRGAQNCLLDCHIFSLDVGEVVLMIRDVTEKRIESDLRQAKEAAEQANELKSAFLASMSHEIRTPLNGVLSMVELLRGTHLSNKQQHYVDAIRSSGQILLSTINDILDFSRIEAGRLRLEKVRFSLSEVIGHLFNATSQRAFEKDLELILQQESEVPDQLIGDPFRIQQVLINLVGNAIKFTEHGEVEINIRQRNFSNDQLMLCIAVSDTGIGIDPKQIQRIFLPFEQGSDNRSSSGEDTGLGLPISKRLVDAMKGKLWVESRLGEGSVFYFEVPLGLVQPAYSVPRLVPDIWYKCKTLVWIQHDALRKSIIHILSSFGFEAHAASSAIEALDWTCGTDKKDRFCLLILDDSLISHEGPNLLNELAARGRDAQFLVLYIVNIFNHDKDELDRLDDFPNVAYVMKPIHSSLMFNALQELFGISNKSRAVISKTEDPSWKILIERLGAREHLSGARILLVEDNLINREVAVEALSMAGIEVQVATNGRESVDMVCSNNVFDGVLMDLQMPIMDGFQATQIIRQHYSMEMLPIIAMTAGVFFKDRQRSLEVGMNDHVGKPVNLRNLMEKLMKWIKPKHPRPWNSDQERQKISLLMEKPLISDGKKMNWDQIELPGILTRNGLNHLGGNQKLYFKLLKSFVKTHDNTEVEILSALANRDTKALRRLAHTLKGVALTLGAELLHNSAEVVEKEALVGQFERVREVTQPLMMHLNKVLNSIQDLLKLIRAEESDLRENSTGSLSSDTIKLYFEILSLLENSDTRLQEICTANQILIHTWFANTSSYENFMEKIETYRFEEARAIFTSDAVIPSLPA